MGPFQNCLEAFFCAAFPLFELNHLLMSIANHTEPSSGSNHLSNSNVGREEFHLVSEIIVDLNRFVLINTCNLT